MRWGGSIIIRNDDAPLTFLSSVHSHSLCGGITGIYPVTTGWLLPPGPALTNCTWGLSKMQDAETFYSQYKLWLKHGSMNVKDWVSFIQKGEGTKNRVTNNSKEGSRMMQENACNMVTRHVGR